MEIKAGLTQSLSPFPLLCSSEKGGRVGVGREKSCLLHSRALALLPFPAQMLSVAHTSRQAEAAQD